MKTDVAKYRINFYFIAAVLTFCMSLSACDNGEMNKLRKENEALKQEISELKETADYHYQQGVDAFKAQNFGNAKEEFQMVLDKFPASPLAKNAEQEITKTNIQISAIEQEHHAEQMKEKVAAERKVRLKGAAVSIDDLLVDPSAYEGKRVRVTAEVGDVHPRFDDAAFENGNPQNFITISYHNLSSTDKRMMLNCGPFANKCTLTVVGIWSADKKSLSVERIEQ